MYHNIKARGVFRRQRLLRLHIEEADAVLHFRSEKCSKLFSRRTRLKENSEKTKKRSEKK
jgi:hypothetical protein